MVLHYKDIVLHFSKHQGIKKSPTSANGDKHWRLKMKMGKKYFGYCQPPGLARVDNNRFTLFHYGYKDNEKDK